MEWSPLSSTDLAWVGGESYRDWTDLGRCELTLSGLSTPSRLFVFGPTPLNWDEGWVVLWRVMFNADRTRAIVPWWGLPPNPPNTQPPLTDAGLNLYTFTEAGWVFVDRRVARGPVDGERLLRGRRSKAGSR